METMIDRAAKSSPVSSVMVPTRTRTRAAVPTGPYRFVTATAMAITLRTSTATLAKMSRTASCSSR
jgi:acetoacetate decarboxylase